jgi:hypothetical protein
MKKTVWLNVSIEVEADGTEHDDDLFMDYANDSAVKAGFIVDDMGVIEEDVETSLFHDAIDRELRKDARDDARDKVKTYLVPVALFIHAKTEDEAFDVALNVTEDGLKHDKLSLYQISIDGIHEAEEPNVEVDY